MNGPESMIVFSWAFAFVIITYVFYKKTKK